MALKRYFTEHPDLRDERVTVDRYVGGVASQSKAGEDIMIDGLTRERIHVCITYQSIAQVLKIASCLKEFAACT